MKKKIKCDVLILGAGVAGSTAALKAVNEGLNTIIVEKNFEETKTRLDITRDAGITGIIKELGLKTEGRSNKSKWFSLKKSFLLASKTIGDYFVKRGGDDSLEATNVMKAVDKGVELITDTGIKRVKKEEQRIKEITFDDRESIHPDYVIVACGQETNVFDRLGIRIEEKNPVAFNAYGVICAGLDVPEKITNVFFDAEKMPQGYFYSGKTSDDFGVAAVVSPKEDVKKRFEQFTQNNPVVRKQMTHCTRINSFYGRRRASEIKKRVYGNVFLTGDSGMFLDPFIGYGINQAIYTGYWAAKAVKKNKAAVFETAVEKMLVEIKQSRRARKVFEKMNNDDFDSLIEELEELTQDDDKALASKAIKNPELRLLLESL